MTTLDEALALWENPDDAYDLDAAERWLKVIVAAARNWQTLSPERIAEAIKTEWSNGGTTFDADLLGQRVFDALTDTTEPEE